MKKKINTPTFKKLMQELGKYRFLLIGSILLSLLTVGLTLYIPILFGDSIDLIIEEGISLDYIVSCLKTISILIIVNSLLTWIMNAINNKIAFNVVKNIICN